MSTIVLVAALDEGGAIGRDGGLPWHLPADLKRFRHLTLDRPLVVGRRTWASIGRPLPRRRMVVLSRQPHFAAPGVEVVHSWAAACALLAAEPLVCVGGGEAVFAAALPDAHALWLSRVEARVVGDTHFPPLDWTQWQRIEAEHVPADALNAVGHTFERWVRR